MYICKKFDWVTIRRRHFYLTIKSAMLFFYIRRLSSLLFLWSISFAHNYTPWIRMKGRCWLKCIKINTKKTSHIRSPAMLKIEVSPSLSLLFKFYFIEFSTSWQMLIYVKTIFCKSNINMKEHYSDHVISFTNENWNLFDIFL
jgi:hypothetical protein